MTSARMEDWSVNNKDSMQKGIEKLHFDLIIAAESEKAVVFVKNVLLKLQNLKILHLYCTEIIHILPSFIQKLSRPGVRHGFDVSDEWDCRNFAEGERLELAAGSELEKWEPSFPSCNPSFRFHQRGNPFLILQAFSLVGPYESLLDPQLIRAPLAHNSPIVLPLVYSQTYRCRTHKLSIRITYPSCTCIKTQSSIILNYTSPLNYSF
ncbi:hypothetical protein TNCV_5053861 [Trichonephila clavipes]|nr:hypothetical protein TNCV_5053861 [Trichonephila clavipes]